MGDRGGYHESKDPRDHYCVRGFRQDGHAYKAIHVYSNNVSRYYRRGGGQFGRNGNTLDLALECEHLGYVISLRKIGLLLINIVSR